MRRRKSQINSLGEILPRKIPTVLSIAMTLSNISGGWHIIAGDKLASVSRPVSIEGDLLVIVCENKSAASLLKMKGATLARAVNRRWRTDFKNLRIVVGKIETARPEKKVKPPEHIRPSERSVEACLNYTSSKIEEPEIAEALARLMATYMVRFPKKDDEKEM